MFTKLVAVSVANLI